MSLYPSAPGSYLLRIATAKGCPGLGREQGLTLMTMRAELYNARLGYHFRDLRDIFPPMALLLVVPAAVATTDAERYFHVAGAPSSIKWTDSRRILGLKLPAERHAHGYALLEVWSQTAAGPTEPEITPRELAREASAATTVLEPITETEDESE